MVRVQSYRPQCRTSRRMFPNSLTLTISSCGPSPVIPIAVRTERPKQMAKDKRA